MAAHEWYAPYVVWAVKKVTDGTGNGNFSPNEAITREQMAKMTVVILKLIRYRMEQRSRQHPNPAIILHFPWALDFVLKLWRVGLLKETKGNFNRSNATRAEAAAFCMRIHGGKGMDGENRCSRQNSQSRAEVENGGSSPPIRLLLYNGQSYHACVAAYGNQARHAARSAQARCDVRRLVL